jgi:hypothetical protein
VTALHTPQSVAYKRSWRWRTNAARATEMQLGPRRGAPTVICPSRATVTSGDQITYTDDDWARWFLKQNGQL